MNSEITFAKRMDILMAWARQQGISATYEAIGNAIGESPTTLQKIHAGIRVPSGYGGIETSTQSQAQNNDG